MRLSDSVVILIWMNIEDNAAELGYMITPPPSISPCSL